jgi:hypothetical protein
MRAILLVIFLTSACQFLNSDYDKLMNPIKKIKLAEKKGGTSNPIYDGFVEPDFPDENENIKTLKGVDSNRDGVRDDIEIWINRTAEDLYVRSALKESYRKQMELFLSLYNNEPEEKVHLHLSLSSAIDGCVAIVTSPYDKSYLKKYQKDAITYYSNTIVNTLFANTSLRSKQVAKWNGFQFVGTMGGDSSVECIKYPFGKRYKEIIDSYKTNNPN